MVEQRTENPRVGSSILPLGTNFYAYFHICRRSSVVEQLIRNQLVGGSTPLAGSILHRHFFYNLLPDIC